MAYNSNKGTQNFGDIHYEGDPAETQIDFEDDLIALKTKNIQRLIVSSSAITASVIFSASAGIHAGTFTGDGAGITGIPAAGVTAAGSTTQVQYNNGDAFAGSANLVFDGSTLTVGGHVTASVSISGSTIYGTELYSFGNVHGAGNLTIDGNTTLGNASGDSVTINAATVNIPNVAAGTDNTVVIYDGNTLVTDEIDSRVWGNTLVDATGTPVANQVAVWSDANTTQGFSTLTFANSTLTGSVSGSKGQFGTVEAGVLTASQIVGGSPLSISASVIVFSGSVEFSGSSLISASSAVLTSLTASAISGGSPITISGDTITLFGPVTSTNDLTCSATVSGSSGQFGILEAGTLTVDGNTTLGESWWHSLTLNSRTINIPNVQAGTDNTVVIYDGNTLVTDEIDSRVWGNTLVDATGTPVANQVAIWNDANTAQGLSTLTFVNNTLTGSVSGSNGWFGTLKPGTLTVDGNTTLGAQSWHNLTINAATIDIPNVAAGTDNTVVVYNGSTLVTDEIDSRVWGSTLVDATGTPVANQVAVWSDSNTAQGLTTMTYDGQILSVTGSISGSGNISGSAFYGDGTNLTNTGLITAYTNAATADRILTSVNANSINAETALTFDGADLTVGGRIVGQDADFSDMVRTSNLSSSHNLHLTGTLKIGTGIDTATSTKMMVSGAGNSVIAQFVSDASPNILAMTGSGKVLIGGEPSLGPAGLHLDAKLNVSGSTTDKLISLKSDTGTAFYVEGGGDTFVSGNLKMHAMYPMIELTSSHNATSNAQIGMNNAGNILLQNNTSNQHIVLKANDNGTIREGFRLNGAVPEVVVNETDDSLVNFRVESDNNTHMLYIKGSSDKAGINTSDPTATFAVSGTMEVSGDTTVKSSFRAKTLEYNTIQFNYGGTGEVFLPFAGTSEQVNATYQQQWVAPYNGALKRLLVRTEYAQNGNISGSIYVGVDGDAEIDAGGIKVESAVGANSATYTTTTINFTGSNHFAAGDLLGVTIQPRLNPGKINLTMIWEFDTTTF